MSTARSLARFATRKRLIRISAAAVGAFAVVACSAILIVVLTAPAAAPVIVASAVLGSAAEVFGVNGGEMTGDELAAAGAEQSLRCDGAPAADPPIPPIATVIPDQPAVGETEPGSGDTDPAKVQPIRIGEGGSVSRENVESLLEPLTPGTSSLRAHVWFLYRLAGLGDWASFAVAYDNAGLSADEDSPDAPLRQVQLLNATGADMERYRLTAAALVSAGQQTGRFTDPYPTYREKVSVELLSSCLADSPSAERMALPAPATTAPPAGPVPKTVVSAVVLPSGVRPA